MNYLEAEQSVINETDEEPRNIDKSTWDDKSVPRKETKL